MFAMVTKVKDLKQRRIDSILSLSLLQLSEEKDIVDLPAIEERKLYIISIKQQADSELRLGGQDLLFVDWQIQFL